MNSSGPRQEPWGIPQVTILAAYMCPSSVQNYFLLSKYELNQLPVIPLMPHFSNYAYKMLWLNVSNAFLRSRNSQVHFSSIHCGVPVSTVYEGCYCGIQFTKSNLVLCEYRIVNINSVIAQSTRINQN